MKHVDPISYIYIIRDERIFFKLAKRFYFFIFFSRFSLRYMEIGQSEFVGQRKQSALLDEGYAWEPKTRDFTEFSIKIRKILCFDFSQIYGFLTVRICRSRM